MNNNIIIMILKILKSRCLIINKQLINKYVEIKK